MDQWRRTYSGEPRDFSPVSSMKKPISSNSVDKDDLIDEMQGKIGELLQVNQDLYKAKNQIELLKETLNVKEQQHVSETEYLQQELDQTKSELHKKDIELEELHDKFNLLIDENNNLKIRIKELKKTHEEVLNFSEEDAKKKMEETKSLLESKISDSSEEVTQLQSQVIDMKTEIDMKNSELTLTKSKLDQTSNENLEQRIDNNKLKNEISELNTELDTVKTYNKGIILENQTKDEEITAFKAEISTLKAELCEKQKLFIPIKEALATIQQHCKNITKPCDVAAFIQQQIEVKDSLKAKNADLSKKIMDLMSKNSKLEQDLIKSQDNEIEARHLNQELQDDLQECNNYLSEIEDKMLYHLELNNVRNKIDNAFKISLDTQLKTESVLSGTYPTYSFRSIILSVLSLRAWIKPINNSPGLMWEPPVSTLPLDSIASETISKLRELTNDFEKVKSDLDHAEEARDLAQRDQNQKENELGRAQNKIDKLKRHIVQYKEEISRRFEPEVVEKHKSSIEKLRKKCKSAIDMLRQRDIEFSRLSNDFEAAQKTSFERKKLLDESDGQLKLMNKQMKTLEDEIDILRSVVDCKRKDIFSLERAVRC